jgi:LPXTG-site transpeptidase (sortase) family protein
VGIAPAPAGAIFIVPFPIPHDEMTEESPFKTTLRRTKTYLKWYTYPLVYFIITSLVCLFAWYARPVHSRAGITGIFKTISVIPSILWVGGITLWILLMFIVLVISNRVMQRFPSLQAKRISAGRKSSQTQREGKAGRSRWRKIVDYSLYPLGIILIFAGASLGVWIARPYITLLLSSSKIEALERKVQLQQVYDNRIIIPSVLIDAPILEGVSSGQLSRGVCHVSGSAFPGEGGNSIIEGHNLAEFGLWKPKSFFSILDIVGEGTPIYIFYNGRKYNFRVKEKIFRDVSDPKLYDMTPGERLTLITCVSTWSPTIYTNKRTVVIAYPEFR